MARARRIASVVSAASALCLAPILSWWLLALIPISLVNLHSVDARMRDSAKPEYQAAASVLLSQCTLALGAAITGGARSPLLVTLAVPAAFAATRFRAAVVWWAAGISLLLMLIVSLASGPGIAFAHPAGLIVAASVTISLTAATQALNGAERHARRAAILDPLTGLLNRHGLDRRFEELAQQARLIDAPVSLLVCDLDRFKEINDLYGHAVGDIVLREVAYAIRKQLRSFELVYRIGGEEFLIVLPGAGREEAAAIGARVSEAVRSCRTEGVSPTVSIGIGTAPGSTVEFERLFADADRALYRAKADGRDCVRVAASAQVQAPAPTPSLDAQAAAT